MTTKKKIKKVKIYIHLKPHKIKKPLYNMNRWMNG